MSISLLLVPLLALQVAEPAAFGQSVAAHKALTKSTVKIEAVAKVGKDMERTTYTFSYIRPNKAKLRIVQPETATADASDRTYTLSGASFVGVDHKANEYLQRTANPKASIKANLDNLLGQVDECVSLVAEPSHLKTFFRQFTPVGSWKSFADRDGIVCTYSYSSKGQSTAVTFVFDKARKLLKEAKMQMGADYVYWKFTYSAAPSSIVAAAPKGVSRVSSFTVYSALAKMSGEAERVGRSVIRAYQGLRSGEYSVKTDSGTTRVWFSGSRMRQQSPEGSWAFDGQTLSMVVPSKKRFYTGSVKGSALWDKLAKVGLLPETFLKQLVTRQNPARVLLKAGRTVRVAGKMKLDGVDMIILEVKDPEARILARVKDGSFVIQSLTSESLGKNGAVVFRSQREFAYHRVNTAIPASTFKLSVPAGYRKVGLP